MVFDENKVYSFGRKPQYYRWTTPMEYMLYASAKQPKIERIGKDQRRGLGAKPPTTIEKEWKTDIPILARAMVLANDTLFIAGPADLIDEHETQKTLDTPETQKLLARQASVLRGSEGAFLHAVSISDGKKLSEKRLDDIPVFDGMIAAGNHLYYATVDGRVVCLGN